MESPYFCSKGMLAEEAHKQPRKDNTFHPFVMCSRASAYYKPQSYNIIAYVYEYSLNNKACFRHWAIAHWKTYCLVVTPEEQTLEQTLH